MVSSARKCSSVPRPLVHKQRPEPHFWEPRKNAINTIMMADRRRRSPEEPSGKRKESRRSDYDESQQMRSARAEHDSYSSSSTSSYIDISRSFPQNRFGLHTFFTAPSERQRLRRQRSRLSKHSNSSSSSVNTDLAYGTGFIKRSKLRRVRSRKGKEIDREKDREREREREIRREKDLESEGLQRMPKLSLLAQALRSLRESRTS
jgi:hypothetical protein